MKKILRLVTEKTISSNLILVSENVENNNVYCLLLKNGNSSHERHSIIFEVSKTLKCGDNIEITLNNNLYCSKFNVIYGFGESSVITCKIISEINDILSSSKISDDFIKSLPQ